MTVMARNDRGRQNTDDCWQQQQHDDDDGEQRSFFLEEGLEPPIRRARMNNRALLA